MRITPIKNQNNRTNFSGWKKVVVGGKLIYTDRIFDTGLLDLVSKIKRVQVVSNPKPVSYFHPNTLVLQDGTRIAYRRNAGSFEVVHDEYQACRVR